MIGELYHLGIQKFDKCKITCGRLTLNLFFKNHFRSTGWCGSADWVLACEPKGCPFDSQSGHMPGLWARSPVRGMWEATDWCTFLYIDASLPLFLPLSLKINKIFKVILGKSTLFWIKNRLKSWRLFSFASEII